MALESYDLSVVIPSLNEAANLYRLLPKLREALDGLQLKWEIIVVDSDSREIDGITRDSAQGEWLQNALAASASRWKIVYFHHPPFSSSSSHGDTPKLQWPFKEWGATAVLSGHDHDYERIVKSDFPYFVTGHGGNALYGFTIPVAGSAVRYNSAHGAMLIEADSNSIIFKAYSVIGAGTLIDWYAISAAK